MLNSETTTHRIAWLDALRGFTMLLVVAYHVAQQAYGIDLKASPSLPLLALLRMPLFFFVSGFLAVGALKSNDNPLASFAVETGHVPSLRAMNITTVKELWSKISKKLRVQLIPTIVFLCVFLVLRTKDFWPALGRAMASPTKDGYWYTWALLLMFIIYYLFEFAESRLRLPSWGIVVLWAASLALYETAYMPRQFSYPKSDFMAYSSFIQVIYYLHFFLFGNIVRRHWTEFQRLFDSRWLFPLLMVVTFVCAADVLKWHTLRTVWTNLPRTLAMYSLMLLVVMAFRHYDSQLSRPAPLASALRFMGQRTLDIYLLHFILMPRLHCVGTWLDTVKPGFLVEQTACLLLAALVTAACLLLSAFLRTSPFLKKYLFGRGK